MKDKAGKGAPGGKKKSPLTKQTGWILAVVFLVLVLLLKGGPAVYAGLGRFLLPLVGVFLIYRYFKGQLTGAKNALESQLADIEERQGIVRLCQVCGSYPHKKKAKCLRTDCPHK